jgi:hypothetical protein
LQFYKNAECKPFSFILQSSSCFPYAVSIHTVIPALPLPDLPQIRFYPFLPLDCPQQKRKSPVKSFATIGGALHS